MQIHTPVFSRNSPNWVSRYMKSLKRRKSEISWKRRIGVYRRTDTAVVSVVKLSVMLLFPSITGSDIQYFLSDTRLPIFTGQSASRTCIDASAAGAAISTIKRCAIGHGSVRKDRSKAHPGPELTCYQLTMAADPTQPGECGRCFVRKITLDIYQVRPV